MTPEDTARFMRLAQLAAAALTNDLIDLKFVITFNELREKYGLAKVLANLREVWLDQ